MEYKHVDGTVYSRYASSPPVINSQYAYRFGIQVPCPVEPGQYSQFNVGNNVKLRFLLEEGRKKMTCHGIIDWVEKDEKTGQCVVGFGHLSLTDEEFRVLEESFTEKSDRPLEFGEPVRAKGAEAVAVTETDQVREIMRLKAVNFPVSVIEAIDENRGDVPFSDFVTLAVRQYIKERSAAEGGAKQ
ncbi:MAG: hypothetical protein FJY85_10245 [Deltaproteobacteria bacterium]|nr:hypothetical protein [Deltaproteobacteria bacterium]